MKSILKQRQFGDFIRRKRIEEMIQEKKVYSWTSIHVETTSMNENIHVLLRVKCEGSSYFWLNLAENILDSFLNQYIYS